MIPKIIIKFKINGYLKPLTANLEEEGRHYEGDMILPVGSSKVTINNLAQRWPNGQVPYVIEGSFSK